MKKKSLKFKLIVGGILVVVIPLMVVGLFSVNKSSKAMTASAKAQAGHIADNLAAMADATLAQEVKLAKQMALEPTLVTATEKVLNSGIGSAAAELEKSDAFFSKIYERIGHDYDMFFITDTNGTVISDNLKGQQF